jgi:hypothetical protein
MDVLIKSRDGGKLTDKGALIKAFAISATLLSQKTIQIIDVSLVSIKSKLVVRPGLLVVFARNAKMKN